MTRADWSALASAALARAEAARAAGVPSAEPWEFLCRKCLARAEALFQGRVLP